MQLSGVIGKNTVALCKSIVGGEMVLQYTLIKDNDQAGHLGKLCSVISSVLIFTRTLEMFQFLNMLSLS